MLFNGIKLLYVEDEEEIIEVMKPILNDFFKEYYIARDGKEALELYELNKPDIMIVDVNLPKMNGLELVSTIRKKDQNVKVIMLTAYSNVEILLKATELKLTKYLVKPLNIREVISSFQLALDEINNLNIEFKKLIPLKDDFSWDIELRTLYKNNKEVRLTPKERSVLEYLFNNQNSVNTYDDIIYKVWEDSYRYSLDTLKTTVKSLRKKLPKDCIVNVYGIGYKIER